jgi:hypothetical protein
MFAEDVLGVGLLRPAAPGDAPWLRGGFEADNGFMVARIRAAVRVPWTPVWARFRALFLMTGLGKALRGLPDLGVLRRRGWASFAGGSRVSVGLPPTASGCLSTLWETRAGRPMGL